MARTKDRTAARAADAGSGRSDATAQQLPPTREAAAEWVERSTLKPWANNPRKNDAAVPAVVASIKRFGFAAPIIARRADGEVIAGHTRLKAAEVLGLDRVPVRFVDLDPADAHLLALADNKLNEKAQWDSLGVAEVLSGYGLDEAELAGWDKAELDALGSDVIEDGEEKPAKDDSERADVGFVVLVDCEGEEDQLRIIDLLVGQGLKCRALT